MSDLAVGALASHARFVLARDVDATGVSGTGVVAEGVLFSNGVVALQWTSAFPTSVVFHERGLESVEAIHGHGGQTRIVFLDAPLAELVEGREELPYGPPQTAALARIADPESWADWHPSEVNCLRCGNGMVVPRGRQPTWDEADSIVHAEDCPVTIARATVNEQATASAAGCYDCGRRYGDEHGFPDLVVAHDVWERISPRGDEGGLLCPSCMCKRAYGAGVTGVAQFRSGPFAIVGDGATAIEVMEVGTFPGEEGLAEADRG